MVAAKPEPLEYVRVCDAFGAGYFYIPGTELACASVVKFVSPLVSVKTLVQTARATGNPLLLVAYSSTRRPTLSSAPSAPTSVRRVTTALQACLLPQFR
ncbi:porin [Rhizobium sp. BIGb0125]|uniref:porin n=1 Tax=Rhizobium sp. BIGb0125 TaxID=2940618 RepID=UPI003864E871